MKQTLKTSFVYWTRWGEYRENAVFDVAYAVIKACWEFAHRCGTAQVASVTIVKTPGDPDDDFTMEEMEAWNAAFQEFKDSLSTPVPFDFYYHHVFGLPFCSAWAASWQLSRWWNHDAEALAFPAIDLVETLLPDKMRYTPHAEIDAGIEAELAKAPDCYDSLLQLVSQTHGLAVGGYRTVEFVDGQLNEHPLKDLIEESVRAYTAGRLPDFPNLKQLLKQYPDLRIRSEIFAMHRNCWNRLEAVQRMDPWAGTFQLIAEALKRGIAVDQEDFGVMLEDGRKSPRTFVEQFERYKLILERWARRHTTVIRRADRAPLPLPNLSLVCFVKDLAAEFAQFVEEVRDRLTCYE